jgi:predicted CXXCH cytochrome family protein
MRFKSFFIAGYILLGLTQLCNGQSGTMIGTKHDFSMTNNTWNFSSPINAGLQGQICRPCHAPHNTSGNVPSTGTQAPLWNHLLSSATYTIYSQGYNFWREGAATIGNPNGSSKLCLSCHDGTVALANFNTYTTGTTNITQVDGGVSSLGTDLSTTHPISFTYDANLSTVDHKLWNPTTTPSGVHGGTITTDMLENGQVQCVSCHDPHNGAGVSHLLIKSNVGSGLCFTCHKI